MKRFLEELANTQAHLKDALPSKTESQRKRAELRKVYSGLINKRALHHSSSTRDSRVVRIKAVTNHYVVVAYKYYGMDYEGEISTCVGYLSLLCGEDRLDVE